MSPMAQSSTLTIPQCTGSRYIQAFGEAPILFRPTCYSARLTIDLSNFTEDVNMKFVSTIALALIMTGNLVAQSPSGTWTVVPKNHVGV